MLFYAKTSAESASLGKGSVDLGKAGGFFYITQASVANRRLVNWG